MFIRVQFIQWIIIAEILIKTRTSIAPIATIATGAFDCECVMYSIERLLSVNTSNPGSFTACGFTACVHVRRQRRHVKRRRRRRGRVQTSIVLPRDVVDVADEAIDRAVEAVVVRRSQSGGMRAA